MPQKVILMNEIKYRLIVFLSIITRFIPIPVKTGLYKIGNPNRQSPVILTGNYILTVAVVKRALKGIDCFLLISNSRGINVWCAATGGHFTNHDIISSLKTTLVEEEVDHRDVILPQLAATGIMRTEIKKKTDWNIIWGPVDVKNIKPFLSNNFQAERETRNVKFQLVQRVELALAWSIFLYVFLILVLFLIKAKYLMDLSILFFLVSLVIYVAMPIYLNNSIPLSEIQSLGAWMKRIGKQTLMVIPFVVIFILFAHQYHETSTGYTLSVIILSLITIGIHNIDLLGMTPIFKGSLENEGYEVIIDESKCRAAAYCETVCPRSCFVVDHEKKVATQPNSDLCVQCGACIVQCPFDALYFENPKGEKIFPETTRKFKLNLMGKRSVKV